MELLARACKTERMNTQRIFARVFVVIGGLFWVFMIWGKEWVYADAPFTKALAGAFFYAVGIAALFIVGLFYEYVASALLTGGALALVVYGAIMGWESGVWAIVFFFFIVPMLIAAALYYLAARMQMICGVGVIDA